LHALVVRLEVMPLDVVLTITAGTVIITAWQAWVSRPKKGYKPLGGGSLRPLLQP
jgi:hypothetical protein